MPAPDPYRYFLEPLERLGLPYCVTGSVASGIYGETRYTADVDFVLALRHEHIRRSREVFPEEDYYLPPDETLIFEVLRSQRGIFNIIHHVSVTKADIFVAGGDPLHAFALRYRRLGELPDGSAVWVAPPEYVISASLNTSEKAGRRNTFATFSSCSSAPLWIEVSSPNTSPASASARNGNAASRRPWTCPRPAFDPARAGREVSHPYANHARPRQAPRRAGAFARNRAHPRRWRG